MGMTIMNKIINNTYQKGMALKLMPRKLIPTLLASFFTLFIFFSAFSTILCQTFSASFKTTFFYFKALFKSKSLKQSIFSLTFSLSESKSNFFWHCPNIYALIFLTIFLANEPEPKLVKESAALFMASFNSLRHKKFFISLS